jgi:hypothetical protein
MLKYEIAFTLMYLFLTNNVVQVIVHVVTRVILFGTQQFNHVSFPLRFSAVEHSIYSAADRNIYI